MKRKKCVICNWEETLSEYEDVCDKCLDWLIHRYQEDNDVYYLDNEEIRMLIEEYKAQRKADKKRPKRGGKKW